MRFTCAVLLSVAGLITSGEALMVSSTPSKMANVTSPADQALLQSDQTLVGIKRSMTEGESMAAEFDSEEKSSLSSFENLFSSVPKIKMDSLRGKMKNAFGSKKPKVTTPRKELTGKALEEQQEYLHRKFLELGLNAVGVNNLFDSLKMKKWVRLKQKYNAKHGIEDTAELDIIFHYYMHEKVVAIMVAIARQTKETRVDALYIQAGLINKWLDGGKEIGEVFRLLSARSNAHGRILWRMYLKMYNKRNISRMP